jgi:hypothetical protein
VESDPAGRYNGGMSLMDEIRLDRTAFSVARLDDPDDSIQFWATRSIEERLTAVELMRQIAYGYDPFTTRLQRVLEIAQREEG